MPEYVYRQLAQDAVTAIIGVPGPRPESQRTEKPENDYALEFWDWDIEVERYVLNPQSFQSVRVRVFFAISSSPDPTGPHSLLQVPSPRPGERVLLLLDKWEPQNTHLEANQFTIVGVHAYHAMGFTGFFEVDGENARIVKANTSPPFTGPWQPLDQIVAAITSPVPIPPAAPTPTATVRPAATNTPCPT